MQAARLQTAWSVISSPPVVLFHYSRLLHSTCCACKQHLLHTNDTLFLSLPETCLLFWSFPLVDRGDGVGGPGTLQVEEQEKKSDNVMLIIKSTKDL